MLQLFERLLSSKLDPPSFLREYQSFIDDAITSERFKREIEFVSEEPSFERLTANFLRQNPVAMLAGTDLCQSTILQLSEPAAAVTIPAAISAMGVLRADNPISIEIYSVVGGGGHPFDIPTQLRVEIADKIELKQSQTLLIKPHIEAYRLSVVKSPVIIHRIDQLDASPYIVSFDPVSRQLSRVTYSNARHTSNNFFVKTLLELIRDRANQGIGRIQALEAVLEYMALSQKIDIRSRWSAILGLDDLAPSKAMAALNVLAESDLPVASAKARRALGQVSGG